MLSFSDTIFRTYSTFPNNSFLQSLYCLQLIILSNPIAIGFDNNFTCNFENKWFSM
jgi:hypothetical protein